MADERHDVGAGGATRRNERVDHITRRIAGVRHNGCVEPDQPYRDASGRTLADYPRPSVAVDTAVLTVTPAAPREPPTLAVLLVRRDPAAPGGRARWALPGTFLHPGETLADAVRRSLSVKAGVTGRDPQQLHVFDDPDRDDRGWVLSVAHLDVLTHTELDALRDPRLTRLAPAGARLRLPYDHAAILALAVDRLRAEYATAADPRRLLGEAFTMTDLRAVHEAIAGRPLQKDTFRRAMVNQLDELPRTTAGRVGRPARLYAHRPA